MKKLKILFSIIFYFTAIAVYPQTKNNLAVFNELVKKSVLVVDSAFGATGIKIVKLSLPTTLVPLSPGLISAFKTENYLIQQEAKENGFLNYILTNAKVSYKNSFSDGLFGDILTEREVRIEGAYFLTSNNEVNEPSYFNFYNIDTVNVEIIPEFENKALTFTCGEIPQASVISNLAGPVIVVASLITTVILLFTVRSK